MTDQTDHPAQVRAIADSGELYEAWAEQLRAAATRIEQLEQEREKWRRERHALESDIFGLLHPALDFPDDVTVVEMARRIVLDLREAERRESANMRSAIVNYDLAESRLARLAALEQVHQQLILKWGEDAREYNHTASRPGFEDATRYFGIAAGLAMCAHALNLALPAPPAAPAPPETEER